MKPWELIYIEFLLSIAEPIVDGKYPVGWGVYWLYCPEMERNNKKVGE